MSRLPTRGEVEAPRPARNVRAALDRILLTSRACTWQAKAPSQGGAELRLDNPASPWLHNIDSLVGGGRISKVS
eukprot:CAMPEP_0183401006 /NCGR_PEP_ID=MMETSP0370-20130417/12982_1 /TAXON_ID=268820 /ORGANISM="Peridinium aciculiferum, Strain PAER-2" /LENGTH=73 /DNA_ID=CAMNT_0025582407 /DNA_START=72 /DNA_END=289 /DNA_ORIENTATION=+